MVKTCAGPSELHLKKELTALQRARFLRDPETCSSWRSPLSSRSLLEASKISNVNGINGSLTRKLRNGSSLEIPSRLETRGEKIYLCNWRHNSSNEEEKQASAKQSPEHNLRNVHSTHPKNETYLEVPDMPYIADTNSQTPGRRSIRKGRKSLNSRIRIIRHSATTKFLESASSPLGFLNSGEQSDDTDNCNSEDLRQLTHDLTTLKTGYLSRSASPLFSRSRCGSWSNSSKILKITRDGSSQSCTPVSTSSYYKYGGRNPSTVGSWDGTGASYGEDELDIADLPQGQGCGIPCYWSKRSKDRTLGAFYSPSLSDTLIRKGSSILCGSQTFYNNKKRPSATYKRKHLQKSSQGLPLLTNSFDGGGSSLDSASDELSTNLGELDLEALSRLDGRRWSSCQSQEGLELARPGGANLEIADQRSLSQKYCPRSFDDIIGQSIVVQSLSNAILRGRIAPAYLFQGPRGTGKTSVVRIFAAALNCLSTEGNKPCWFCKECATFLNRNNTKLKEVDATNKKGIDEVRYLLKNLSLDKEAFQYKVIVIDECHMLPSKIWSVFMKFLEEPLPRVVFIFITIEPDNLPRAIISRCQKYIFSKIKDVDISCRLKKLSAQENLDVGSDALDLIALNSDGSLRDAETTLEQLSLLGRKITTSLVNDVVGVVSDEKLFDLLEIAMSSDTAETVKRSRELMESGVDPMALMSQLAGLIMDIIAGTYRLTDSQSSATTLGSRSLTEAELERLQQALKILSDAEKQLRLSSERSTWFTAALLQLGSGHNTEPSASTRSSSSKNITRNINYGESNTTNDSTICENRNSHSNKLLDSSQANDNGSKTVRSVSPNKLEEIWTRCIERCHSKTLRQLLCSHGRLVSITENEGILVASIAFDDDNMKARAERFASSITDSIEIVLRQNVEVKIGLVRKNLIKPHAECAASSQRDSLSGYSNKDRLKGPPNLARKSLDSSQTILRKLTEKVDRSAAAEGNYPVANVLLSSIEGKYDLSNNQEEGQELLAQKSQHTALDEQRLESAWLQAAEKYAPGSVSHPKPEKNQVLPQNGVNCHNHDQPSGGLPVSSKHWEDELNQQLKGLKINGSENRREEKIGGTNHCAVSPSLLHSNNYIAKKDTENLGYESGPGCNGLLCWKTPKEYEKKAKQGNRVRSQSTSRLSLFGQCAKLK